jgi:pimeloyl-ACP methyl ester carboxylesterase
MAPTTRYAKSGDVNIAYQVVGEGPIDLVVNWGWLSHVEVFWDDPDIAEFLSRLASFARLIVFDKRGTGMSDRVAEAELPTLEQRMDDVRAVMDAAGSQRAALLGISEGGPLCVLFAATYPDRCTALLLFGSWATWVRDDTYPWVPTLEQHERAMELLRVQDPSEPFNLERFAPTKAGDQEFRKRFARYGRLSASPGAALALYRMNIQVDVRGILGSVHVPTLVIHRAGDRLSYPQAGRYVADHIGGAKYVELPGNDHLVWVGDREAVVGEIEEFLTGVRHAPETNRVLATVLFTDLVGSTELLARIGDERWRAVLADHHRLVRAEFTRFGGREIDNQGDGFLASFDGPARAVRCALAIRSTLRSIELTVRQGLHTGEVEVVGPKLEGLAVHVGARVASAAGGGEILVSRTVKDLVAGSGLRFTDRGAYTLKGVPDEWHLYAVDG